MDAGVETIFIMLPLCWLSKTPVEPLLVQILYLPYLAVVFYMLKRWGQTPGKMAMGIKVVRTDLAPIGWKEILIRNWYEMLFGIFYLMEYFWAYQVYMAAPAQVGSQEFPVFFRIFDEVVLRFNGFWAFSELVILLTNKRKRALHDYLAETLVVLEEKPNPLARKKTALVAVSAALLALFIYFNSSNRFSRELLHAQFGEPFDQYLLGKDYYLGAIDPQNKQEAYRWFRMSADQGNKFAQEYLGKMYEDGEYVKADKEEAIKWYKLASENGNYEAKKDLKRLGVEP